MEFYEGTDSIRYKSFYDRIQKLLTNPVVFDVMRNSGKKKKKEEKIEQESSVHLMKSSTESE